MLITLTVFSILAVSAIVWLANKVLPFAVCPICAGVFLTWVGLVGMYFAGYRIDLTVPALLMGGSVVGIAYQLEKEFAKPLLLWKVFFISAGFVAAYGILEQLWVVSLITIIFLLLISLLFIRKTNARNEATIGLEEKMKECC